MTEEKTPGRDPKNVKERTGIVISAKSDNTVIVSVERRIRHRRYSKYISVRKKFAVHDTLGCAVGDRVTIRETRPISKTKRWRVATKVGTEA